METPWRRGRKGHAQANDFAGSRCHVSCDRGSLSEPRFRRKTELVSLQGVVKNSSGAPVSGAFVKMKNAEGRLTFMVISQAQGRYSVNSLPAGKYVVQGIGGDYQSEPSMPVEVAAGKSATVDLSLTVARAPQLPGAWPGRLPGEQVGEGGEGGAGSGSAGRRRQADRRGEMCFLP